MSQEHDPAQEAANRELDRLLERAGHVEVPSDLAKRMRQRVADAGRERTDEARLDALLDQWTDPEVPADLAARVLARVPRARMPRARMPREGAARRMAGARLVLALAAATVLAFVGGWWLRARSGSEGTDPGIRVASRDADGSRGASPLEQGVALAEPEEPSLELLEALDALENWELLTTDEVDLLLAGLDLDDEALFELETELTVPIDEGAVDDASQEKG